VPESPLAAALDGVRKPLRFAAGETRGPAHPERLKNLETAVTAAVGRALALRIPRDFRGALERVAADFGEPVPAERRPEVARRALKRLEPLADPTRVREALVRPVSVLPGLGPRRAEALAKRGLGTVADLLFHLPRGWEDRRALRRVGDLEVGRRATFVARVLVCDFVPQRVRGRFHRVFQAVVGDDTGTVTLKWFRAGDTMAKVVRKDALLLVTGEVRRYRFSKELLHPEVDRVAEDADPAHPASGLRRVVPEYSTPEGVHPRTLRSAVARAVEEYADLLEGHLPPELVAERGLPDPSEALRRLHEPDPDADVEALRERTAPAFERLVLEELYLLELGLALRRAGRKREPALPVAGDGPRVAAALRQLPFRLTRAQQRVWRELRGDLARPHPMNRLLEGDVGSGKTVVAWLAAVAAAEGGLQTALMAPTEILAEQHARTLRRLVETAPAGERLRMALLTASLPPAEARAERAALARGEVDLVVGTHALVQERVAFAKLGLVVVDEQHRFGVLQRAALGAKGPEGALPHVLVMTATPIPRTLALTAWGDLDLSVIDELPPGRRPARTLLLRPGETRRAGELLREATGRGEQVYVVYPLVEETERSDLRAAREQADKIRAAFPKLCVDLVHGRLDAAARADAMARFEAGETDVLVCTTVIEVGVDVPNATLMVVEHAERFGLAQLHQLRGRVGRGERPGTCVLVARGGGEDAEARMEAMLATTDGFEIAEADLRIRGPGEFLGTRQHGRLPDLRIADLVRDARHVSRAREAALAAVRRDPGLRRQPELRDAVRRRWGDRLALADVG